MVLQVLKRCAYPFADRLACRTSNVSDHLTLNGAHL